jgi:hypothetical protein
MRKMATKPDAAYALNTPRIKAAKLDMLLTHRRNTPTLRILVNSYRSAGPTNHVGKWLSDLTYFVPREAQTILIME